MNLRRSTPGFPAEEPMTAITLIREILIAAALALAATAEASIGLTEIAGRQGGGAFSPLPRAGLGVFAMRAISQKYVELPGADHFAWVGDTEGVIAEVEEFLTGVRPRRALCLGRGARGAAPRSRGPGGRAHGRTRAHG